MNQKFCFSIFIPIFLTIFISIFFVPNLNNYSPTSFKFHNTFNQNTIESKLFLWPTPGYTKITSNFGYRKSPTAGAGTYHGGIDIAAPQNTAILAIDDGIVSYIGWNGANGYTAILSHSNGYKSIYGHISPNFLVYIGEKIAKGQKIATVGPKYIDKQIYTTYIDKTSGKYTNGATTRTTSALRHYSK